MKHLFTIFAVACGIVFSVLVVYDIKALLIATQGRGLLSLRILVLVSVGYWAIVGNAVGHIYEIWKGK